MGTVRRLAMFVVAGSTVLALLSGCGNGNFGPAEVDQENLARTGQGGTVDPGSVTQTSASENSQAQETASGLPTAAILSSADPRSLPDSMKAPEEGSPEWLINEILKLRMQKGTATDDAEKLRAHRRWRNEKIIKLAQDAIAQTHQNPQQERVFNVAVHHLMESRLQLALQIDQKNLKTAHEEIDSLYGDADALFQRDGKSQAAAEAAFVRAKFVNINAQRFADREPNWLIEFSQQARLFAHNFEDQQNRAVALLDAAARSCELHRIREEALNCYSLLKQRFPNTPQGQQAAAILRRFALEGQRLEKFGGPTIDGGFVHLDEFQGRVVLLIFWSSDSKRFVRQLPHLTALTRKNRQAGLAVIGVCLDTETAAAEELLKKNSLYERVILWPEAERRRWNNPIVKYYGIRDIPTYWLIDRNGVVVDMLVDPTPKELQLTSPSKSRKTSQDVFPNNPPVAAGLEKQLETLLKTDRPTAHQSNRE